MTFFCCCLNAAGIEICFYKRENDDFLYSINNFLRRFLKPQFVSKTKFRISEYQKFCWLLQFFKQKDDHEENTVLQFYEEKLF